MPKRSQPQTPAPSTPPRENKILAVPATPEDCQRDYAAGKTVRAVMDNQDRKRR